MKLLMLLLPMSAVFAQANLGFELGTFEGWQARAADSIFTELTLTSPISDRHQILTGAVFDPFIDDEVQVVCPDGKFFVKLGNELTGNQSESLESKFLVEQGKEILIYRYSVVLDEPWHPSEERPGLTVRIHDSDNPCYFHRVEMTDSLGPFQTREINFRKIRFCNAFAGAFDLSDSVGEFCKIELRTNDCSLGGHFGYAYVDLIQLPKLTEIGFCDKTITVTAPDGFQSYFWDGVEGTNTKIIREPRNGQIVSCRLQGYFGCPVEIRYRLKKLGASECRNYPLFFTPNADGINDCWKPNGSWIRIFIYNRFGQLISSLSQNDCWDGIASGRAAPSDDYWFVAIDANGSQSTGHFSLVR